MSLIWKRLTIGMIVLVFVVSSAVEVGAQWTVNYYRPYQAYYAPSAAAYQTYYAPSAYQTYYAPSTAYQTYYAPAAPAAAPVVYTSGWYPGYWLDRTRAALFGRRTVAAAYPTTYAASYPPTYTASYPTSYTASYPTSYVASYPAAAPACNTCAPAQQVTMRPVCTTGCTTCDSCTGCAVSNISQTSYLGTSPACTNCTAAPATSSGNSLSPTPANGFDNSAVGNGTAQPGLSPSDATPSVRVDSMRINGANGQEGGQEGGAADGTADPLEQFLQDRDGQSFFDAPELFDPQDKTVKYSPAPVHRAVYKRPAGSSPDRVTTRPITFEKSQRDAVGWTSAAK